MKDKYKALEKRLNRTLLERDLLRRAIKDLEKKTGMLAERTELTPDEMAASDRKVEEAAQARATAEAAQQQAVAAAEPSGTTGEQPAKSESRAGREAPGAERLSRPQHPSSTALPKIPSPPGRGTGPVRGPRVVTAGPPPCHGQSSGTGVSMTRSSRVVRWLPSRSRPPAMSTEPSCSTVQECR